MDTLKVELTASTCFEHYLLIIRRQCMYSNWYTVCVLCRLDATRVARNMQRLLIRNKVKTKNASCWSYYTDSVLLLFVDTVLSN
jgi:hypothetical protein